MDITRHVPLIRKIESVGSVGSMRGYSISLRTYGSIFWSSTDNLFSNLNFFVALAAFELLVTKMCLNSGPVRYIEVWRTKTTSVVSLCSRSL